MQPQKILIVEDEPSIADALIYVLEAEGFTSTWVQLAAKALEILSTDDIAAVLLDIGLPDSSGLEVCKEIRTFSEVPILFLTARKDEIDRIVGLEIGADDYISKPFSPREVAARVKAVLRRGRLNTGQTDQAEASLNIAGFNIDDQANTISYQGQQLELTRYEYLLLQCLLEQPGRVFSRAQLLDRIWDTPVASLERSIDTHVRSLRAKLSLIETGYQPIKTRRGFGYFLELP